MLISGLTGITGALALGAPAQAAARHEPDHRPVNILFAIADDWGYPDAGANGSPAARTPTFDRLAADGALFERAFCAAPSCTPSRNAVLTGQAPHRLGAGTNLWSELPADFQVYPDLLEEAGYRIGRMRKGYGPGVHPYRPHDPAGPGFPSFAEFLDGQSDREPFCFWFGSSDPHRPYDPEFGEQSGIDPASVDIPPYLPDTPEIRDDAVNYLAEVERFDREVGEALQLLEDRGLAENTMVVMTGDHGWPWPRAKTNLYDSGTRVPLAIRWPKRVSPGTEIDRLTVLSDLAPTFLQAAGLPVPEDMTGQSLLPALSGRSAPREFVVLERERHTFAREGNVSYPVRALRSDRWLYLRNFFPERWPAGDPQPPSPDRGIFGDIDGGPTKTQLLDHRDEPEFARFFQLATGKRPAEELYDLESDPHSLVNLADDPGHAAVKARLGRQLQHWMRRTEDPRATDPRTDFWDKVEYHG
ncbi:Choline-sulfatase [Streptomyces sp. YIM 130001]|uniref:sulfatase family protein n=1 Tax=Streptomyces sp. YIM 130001 TaxID=2259644 RepID=UPI000E64A126|nr:sulfatase [Streptomyces sp. YIM 130001]RII20742.1 Choline-sulfatase [Streptomyces sp. YIM 130001]